MKTSDHLLGKYRDYAVYVNEERAIPRLTDGLKNVQRMVLWVMRNKSGKIKTAAVPGDMISQELYLHGDVAAAEATSLMAAPFANNSPLLEHEGNFGTLLSPRAYSSPRYTYVKRGKYADRIVLQDMNIIPMTENHDGSRMMPETFLPLLPVVLMNGIDGTGVGFATSIMPRDLGDLINATAAAIRGQKSPLKNLEPHFTSHDCRGKLVKYKNNGSPEWEFEGEAEVVDTSTLRVTKLPPVNVTIEEFRQILIDMEEAGDIKGFDDNSSKAVDITVKMRRGSVKDWTRNDAIDFFKLRRRSSENITVVGFDGESIKTYIYDPEHQYPDPVERLVRDWVEWRFSFMVKRFEAEIFDTETKLGYLRLLKACFDNGLSDNVKTMNNKFDMVVIIEGIAEAASIDVEDGWIDRICNRAIYRWTSEEQTKVHEQVGELEELLEVLVVARDDPEVQRDIFEADVKELKSV